jgi:hypothetical protein
MKTSKKLLICFIIGFLSINAQAQLSVGVQGTVGAFSFGVGKLKGFGFEAGYGILKSRRHEDAGSKLFLCASFNMYSGGTGSDYYYGYAYSSATTYSEIEIPYTWKLKMYQTNIGAKYYIAGGMSAPFSFYGQLGLTVVAMPVKYTSASYDRNLYYTTAEPESKTYIGAAFHGGLGFDVKAGPVHIYLATRLQVPVNTVNGEEIDVVIPFGAMADLGIRVPIGGKK